MYWLKCYREFGSLNYRAMKTSTVRAMKQCNIRYFSQLSAKQKDKSSNYIRLIINGLSGLEIGLAMMLLNECAYVPVSLEGCKMVKSPNNGVYIPINIREVIKESNELTKN